MVVCNTSLMQLPAACSITPIAPYLSALCQLSAIPAITCNRYQPLIAASAPITCPPPVLPSATMRCPPPPPSPHNSSSSESSTESTTSSATSPNDGNVVPGTTNLVSLPNGVTPLVPLTQGFTPTTLSFHPFTPKLVTSQSGTTNSVTSAPGIYTCTPLTNTGVVQCTPRVVNGQSVLQCTPRVVNGHSVLQCTPRVLNGQSVLQCTPRIVNGQSVIECTPGVVNGQSVLQCTPRIVNGQSVVECTPGIVSGQSVLQCTPGVVNGQSVMQCTPRIVNGQSVMQCTPGVCPINPAILPNTSLEVVPPTTVVPDTPTLYSLNPQATLPSSFCAATQISSWKQSYGMEQVWQCEFRTLFSQYLPNSWILLPVMAKPEGIWNANVDSAKVRFCCEECGHGWTSMKGRVAFWFVLNPATGEGVVCLKLYGQQCDRCKNGTYEQAMWYPEEVLKVLVNIYNRVGQAYYGFQQAPYHRARRAGKPRTPHNSELCQACKDGVCSERR